MLLWLSTRTDPAARELGHLAEAIALDARTRRQGLGWREHQQRTIDAILRVASQCRQNRLAVILGAGSCHDVPVAALAAQFERVHLVDIVQLSAARKLCKLHRNVKWVTEDLTGIVAALAARRGRFDAAALAALTLPTPPVLQQPDIDFVASVNLLSQLPVKPAEYLQRMAPALTIEDLNAFAWRLLKAHVAALRQLRVPICLVADEQQRTWNRHGELVEQVELISALGLSAQVLDRWRWPLAPPGELADGHHAEHDVVAFQL